MTQDRPGPGGADVTAAAETRPFPWREVLELAFRRKLIILAGLALGGLAALWNVLSTPPLYRSSARILLSATAAAGPRKEAMSEVQIQTELTMLRDPSLIRDVLLSREQENPSEKTTDLGHGPFDRLRNFAADRLPGVIYNVPSPDPLERRVRAIARWTTVQLVAESNVVEVACVGTDPRWTADLVNDMLDHHVGNIASLDGQASTEKFNQEQHVRLEREWKDAQDAVAEYKARFTDDLMGGDENQLRTVWASLEAQHVAAETEVRSLDTRLLFLQQEVSRRAEPGVVNEESAPVQKARQRLLDLKLRRSEQLADYPESSPVIANLDRQIEQAEQMLRGMIEAETEPSDDVIPQPNPTSDAIRDEMLQIRAQQAAAQERLEMLDKEIDRYRTRLQMAVARTGDLKDLENRLTLAEQEYLDQLKKEAQAQTERAMQESRIVNVEIIKRAEPSSEPMAVDHRKDVSIAMVVGLGAGIGLAFLRDLLDPSVKSGAQASRLAKVPVIGELP